MKKSSRFLIESGKITKIISKYNTRYITECDKNFRIQNTSSIENWKSRLPLYNQKCLNCEAISICGGGCPWTVEKLTGNLLPIDKGSCKWTKEVFKYILRNFSIKNEIQKNQRET